MATIKIVLDQRRVKNDETFPVVLRIRHMDKFLDRGVNAFDFTTGVSDALDNRNSKHSWFLQ